MIPVVFSDVGGTLFAGTPWNMIRHHPDFNHGAGQREILKFLPIFLLSQLKLLNESTMRQKWLARMAAALAGLSREQIHDIYHDTIHGDLQEIMRQDVVNRLVSHKEQGATVMLVSGIFVDFVEMIAEHIGIDGAIGTEIEYVDNIATGRLAAPPCVGQNKIDYIKQYLAEHHPGVMLNDCYGYADSYSDRALLTAVGHGVATYPDQRIRRMALDHDWEVIPD